MYIYIYLLCVFCMSFRLYFNATTCCVRTIRLFIVVWITGRGMSELPWIARRSEHEHATVWRQIRYQNGEAARSVQNAGWCCERCLGRVAWTLVFTVQGLKLCRQSWLLTESSRILCTYRIYFQMYVLTRGYKMRVGSIYFSLVRCALQSRACHRLWAHDMTDLICPV